jgi:hypothetical protein
MHCDKRSADHVVINAIMQLSIPLTRPCPTIEYTNVALRKSLHATPSPPARARAPFFNFYNFLIFDLVAVFLTCYHTNSWLQGWRLYLSPTASSAAVCRRGLVGWGRAGRRLSFEWSLAEGARRVALLPAACQHTSEYISLRKRGMAVEFWMAASGGEENERFSRRLLALGGRGVGKMPYSRWYW